jgi:hypothetical protein
MAWMESRIEQHGHSSVTLESSPNAVGFYKRLGYQETGLPDERGAHPMARVLG